MRRRFLHVWFMVMALALPSVALAAVPPDLAFDAAVTVSHVDLQDGPIAGADVTLTATRDGVEIQALTGTTAVDGTAQFTGVARATAGSPVLLDIVSRRTESWNDPESGCAGSTSWTGSASSVVVEPVTTVDLLPTQAGSTVCLPDGAPEGAVPDGTVDVTVVLAPGVSEPWIPADVIGGLALVLEARTADEGVFSTKTIDTTGDGLATFLLVPRQAGGGPEILLDLTTRLELVVEDPLPGGCGSRLGVEGSRLGIPSGPVVDVTIELQPFDEVFCIPPPSGEPSGPPVTLPPTDSDRTGPPETIGGTGVVLTVMALLAAGLVLGVATARRRGARQPDGPAM